MAWGQETCPTGVECRAGGLGTNTAQPSLASWRTGRGPGLALAALVGRRGCTRGWGGSGTFWAFLTSPPQQRLIGPGLPSPRGGGGAGGGSGQSDPMPQSSVRSGTGEGAGEARLPNRQIKHVLRTLAVKGRQQYSGLVWFFKGLIPSISKIARK